MRVNSIIILNLLFQCLYIEFGGCTSNSVTIYALFITNVA